MVADSFDISGHKHAEKNRFLEIPLLSCYFSRQLNFSWAETYGSKGYGGNAVGKSINQGLPPVAHKSQVMELS